MNIRFAAEGSGYVASNDQNEWLFDRFPIRSRSLQVPTFADLSRAGLKKICLSEDCKAVSLFSAERSGDSLPRLSLAPFREREEFKKADGGKKRFEKD